MSRPKIDTETIIITRQEKKTGRTPHRNNPTQLVRLADLKKATRLSIYLYISAHYTLADRQHEFIAHFQAKLNLDEIQSALKFMHVLTTDPRTRARMHVGESHDDSFNRNLVPFSRPRPISLEQRRIGVGYRDKGSLPKPSSPDWEKKNERAVSIRDENAPYDLTLIPDLLAESDEESAKVLSRLRRNYPELATILGVQTHKLENPEPGVWIITQL